MKQTFHRSSNNYAITTSTELPENATQEIESAVSIIGGHISDLETLIVRFRSGKGITESVSEMLDDAKKQLLLRGFGGKLGSVSTGNKWTKTQLWSTMKALSNGAPADYFTLLDTIFEGDEEPLHSLVKQNILSMSIQQTAGRESKLVRAHSPLTQRAFQELLNDTKIKMRMEKLITDEKAGLVKKDIRDVEEELLRLAKTTYTPAVGKRQEYLHKKLDVKKILLSRSICV